MGKQRSEQRAVLPYGGWAFHTVGEVHSDHRWRANRWPADRSNEHVSSDRLKRFLTTLLIISRTSVIAASSNPRRSTPASTQKSPTYPFSRPLLVAGRAVWQRLHSPRYEKYFVRRSQIGLICQANRASRSASYTPYSSTDSAVGRAHVRAARGSAAQLRHRALQQVKDAPRNRATIAPKTNADATFARPTATKLACRECGRITATATYSVRFCAAVFFSGMVCTAMTVFRDLSLRLKYFLAREHCRGFHGTIVKKCLRNSPWFLAADAFVTPRFKPYFFCVSDRPPWAELHLLKPGS